MAAGGNGSTPFYSSDIVGIKIPIDDDYDRFKTKILSIELSLALIYSDIIHDFKGGRGGKINNELELIFNGRPMLSDHSYRYQFEKFIEKMSSTNFHPGSFDRTSFKNNYYKVALFGSSINPEFIDIISALQFNAMQSIYGTNSTVHFKDIPEKVRNPGRYTILYPDDKKEEFRQRILPSILESRINPLIVDNGPSGLRYNNMLNPFDSGSTSSSITPLTEAGKRHIKLAMLHFFGIELKDVNKKSGTNDIYILERNDGAKFEYTKHYYSVANVQKDIKSKNYKNLDFFKNASINIAHLMYRNSNTSNRRNKNYDNIILILLKTFGDFLLSGIIPLYGASGGLHILNTDIQTTDILFLHRILLYQLFYKGNFHKCIIHPEKKVEGYYQMELYLPPVNKKLALLNEFNKIKQGILFVNTAVKSLVDSIGEADREEYIKRVLFKEYYKKHFDMTTYELYIQESNEQGCKNANYERRKDPLEFRQCMGSIINHQILCLSLNLSSIEKLNRITDEKKYIYELLDYCSHYIDEIDEGDIDNISKAILRRPGSYYRARGSDAINKFVKLFKSLRRYMSDITRSYELVLNKTSSVSREELREFNTMVRAAAGGEIDDRFIAKVPLEIILLEKYNKISTMMPDFKETDFTRLTTRNQTHQLKYFQDALKNIREHIRSLVTKSTDINRRLDGLNFDNIKKLRKEIDTYIGDIKAPRRSRRIAGLPHSMQGGGNRGYIVNHLGERIPIKEMEDYYYTVYSSYYKRIHKEYEKSLKNIIDVQTRKLNKLVIQTLPKYKINKDDVISILSKYNENNKQEIPLKLSENTKVNDVLGKTMDKYKLYYDLGQKNIFRTVINQLNQLS